MNPFITHSTMTQLYVAASVSMLVYCNSIRRRHYLTRTGILPTSASPWRHLYENDDDGSLLNLTGSVVKLLKKCTSMHMKMWMNIVAQDVQDYSILAMNWDLSYFILVCQWSIQSCVYFSGAHQVVAVLLSIINLHSYLGDLGIMQKP